MSNDVPGLTPSQTAGPFLSIGLLREIVTPHVVDPADPRAVVISGLVLDGAGEPVTDGLVETWQANGAGRYAHPADTRAEPALEDGFRGFGRSGTVDGGRYELVTVKPGRVPWPGGGLQAPHLEVGVFARGLLKGLVTRMYFPDEMEANDCRPGPDAARGETTADVGRTGGGRRAPLRHRAAGPGPDDVLRGVTIVVTGATGHVGGLVAEELARRGLPFRIVVRDPVSCGRAPRRRGRGGRLRRTELRRTRARARRPRVHGLRA